MPTVDGFPLGAVKWSLAGMDERKAKVVEFRFFGGMTINEVANVIGVSASTVEADWRMARAWLSKALADK